MNQYGGGGGYLQAYIVAEAGSTVGATVGRGGNGAPSGTVANGFIGTASVVSFEGVIIFQAGGGGPGQFNNGSGGAGGAGGIPIANSVTYPVTTWPGGLAGVAGKSGVLGGSGGGSYADIAVGGNGTVGGAIPPGQAGGGGQIIINFS